MIITSTTGDGEAPDTAQKFWRRLKKKTNHSNQLANLTYAILGKFCQPCNHCWRLVFLSLSSLLETGFTVTPITVGDRYYCQHSHCWGVNSTQTSEGINFSKVIVYITNLDENIYQHENNSFTQIYFNPDHSLRTLLILCSNHLTHVVRNYNA